MPDAPKGAVLNTRILWTFSSAYNFLKDEAYLELAHRAYRYLINNFWDKENGGILWSLNPKGEPLDSRKQIYAQGFAIYGLSEYYKATGNKESLGYAIKLFELIEKWAFDPRHGGYLEALSNDWGLMADMRLSAKDANEPKSMNTHLHIIEPHLVFQPKKNILSIYLVKEKHQNKRQEYYLALLAKLKPMLNLFVLKKI